MQGRGYYFDAGGEGFLAEDVLIGFHSLDSLLGVYCCHGCNDDCLQTLVLEHVIVGFIYCYTVWLQGRLRLLQFRVIGSTDGDKLSLWSAV